MSETTVTRAEIEFTNAEAEASARNPAVAEVLALADRLDQALITGDKALFAAALAADVVVNNPANMVARHDQVLGFFERGLISYSVFRKRIDYAAPYGSDHVVLMGEEIYVPRDGATNAGRTVHRRFTDLWRREGDGWVTSIRHATIYKVE